MTVSTAVVVANAGIANAVHATKETADGYSEVVLDGAFALLASDAGSYMTGQTLVVDGGVAC